MASKSAPGARVVARVVAIANPKGGVGKTVTAVNLAASAAQQGRSTLLVDCDPQGHAGVAAGVDLRGPGTAGLLTDHAALSDLARPSPHCAALSVVPADLRLEAAARPERTPDELWLARALAPARATWDLIFLDLPPGLGPLSRAALLAADRVLVPVAGGALGALSARRFIQTLPQLTEPLGLRLPVHALFTRFRRQNASRDSRAALHRLGVPYLDGSVREAAAVERSLVERHPIVLSHPSSGPARDYTKACSELFGLLRKEGARG